MSPIVLQEKRNKYRTKPVVIDGHRFDSQKEAKRYGELKMLEKAGRIQGLVTQPEFALYVGRIDWKDFCPIEVGKYRADFAYYECGQRVVEDVKSPPTRTALYRWKVKHLRAQYGITVREV